MGTRHHQSVITKEGDIKIMQYGQWDGSPDGQGVEILDYLRSGDLDTYQKELNKIPLINEQQSLVVNSDDYWASNYPYLSRDCGSQIHQMIEKGEVNFVSHMDMKEAEKWCDGFYIIDFSKNKFTTKFYGHSVSFDLDNLPSEEIYLKAFEVEV